MDMEDCAMAAKPVFILYVPLGNNLIDIMKSPIHLADNDEAYMENNYVKFCCN